MWTHEHQPEEVNQRDQHQGSQAPGTFANTQEAQLYQQLLSRSNKASTKAQSLGYPRMPAPGGPHSRADSESQGNTDHRVSDLSAISTDFQERSGEIWITYLEIGAQKTLTEKYS